MTPRTHESMRIDTRPHATPGRTAPADASWTPRSAGDAALRFALVFALTQPAGLLLLALVFGRDIPLRSVSAWTAYGITVLLAGATVGVLWFRAQRLPAGTWRREWALASLGFVGFSLLLNVPNLDDWSLAEWIVASAVGSVVVGAVIAGFGRLRGPRSGV